MQDGEELLTVDDFEKPIEADETEEFKKRLERLSAREFWKELKRR